MNLKHIVFLIATSVSVLPIASAQNFINLDFEQAQVVFDTRNPGWPIQVYASNAIPGWIVSNGYFRTVDIAYNEPGGLSPVSLIDTNSGIGPSTVSPLDGNFSITLGGGPFGTIYSINQAGLVPISALSLRFIATNVPTESTYPGLPLQVSLGGQNISLTPIGTVGNGTVYGGDISAFAGLIETLKFSLPRWPGDYWEIDDIQFSPSPIPEPSVFGLLVFGGLLFSLQLVPTKVGTARRAVRQK